MTAEIVWEGSTLCRTLWWGMVFAAEYDTIRIFRRIVKHNMLVIMVLEDMAYWIYVSIKIFSICFYVITYCHLYFLLKTLYVISYYTL